MTPRKLRRVYWIALTKQTPDGVWLPCIDFPACIFKPAPKKRLCPHGLKIKWLRVKESPE